MRLRVIAVAIGLSLCAVAFHLIKDEARQWASRFFSAPTEDPVPTLLVKRQNYRVIVPAQGELAGLKTTPVLTPRVQTGSLKVAWLVEEGSVVQPDEPLVYFDETDALLTLEQNQNQLATFDHHIQQTRFESQGELQALRMDGQAAELELDYAQDQIRKDEDIFSRWEIEMSIMSAALAAYKKDTVEVKHDLRTDLSQTNLKILGIDKTKAEVEANLAKETLSSLAVTAPERGVVIYQRFGFNPLEVGSETWPGRPLMDIASTDHFRATLRIPETDLAGVEPAKPVQLWIEAFPEQTFQGKIETVARVAKQIERTDPRKYFECDVILEVPPEMMQRMKPGMRLKAEIETARYESAFVLPKSAVIKKETEFVVFTSEEDYREQQVKILDSDYGFYVVEGLEDDSLVCLQHPFEKQQLHLPDFNAPVLTQQRRFVIFY